MNPTVTPLLMFEDNYGYLLSGKGDGNVIVIDPSDGEQVWTCLENEGYTLTAILATHHHFDHVAGIDFLHSKKNVPVYCSAREYGRIPKASHGLKHEETIQIGELNIQAIHVPGHTAGHLAYRCGDALFTGDTLFLGGCGRLFEGTAEELYDSLYQKIMVLPERIRIFPGHEYTLRTRSFCLSIDEHNPHLQTALQEAACHQTGIIPAF